MRFPPGVHARPAGLSIRQCQPRWRPSDPILAQPGFASGPRDCSGSMDRRTERRAEARALRPSDETVFRPPPHQQVYPMRRFVTYKDEGRSLMQRGALQVLVDLAEM